MTWWWLLTIQIWVQCWVTLSEINFSQSTTIIPPLLHTPCFLRQQAVHFHTCDPKLRALRITWLSGGLLPFSLSFLSGHKPVPSRVWILSFFMQCCRNSFHFSQFYRVPFTTGGSFTNSSQYSCILSFLASCTDASYLCFSHYLS